MISLTSAQITDALKPYGIATSIDLIKGVRTYTELLLKWNRSISLTSVTDVEQILRFHFGESLFALSMLPVEKSRLADVGSGAGFPGIPLAMVSPNLTVTLIESNAKKYAFLNEVIRELKLRNRPKRQVPLEMEPSSARSWFAATLHPHRISHPVRGSC